MRRTLLEREGRDGEVAKPGDQVAAEDELLILESMKMEIPVVAPQAGTVKSILVAEEETVSEGQPLVLLES